MLIRLFLKKLEQPLIAAPIICAPCKDYRTEINDTFVGFSDFINIAMPMYKLIEYSNNYSDSSGRLKEIR